RVRPRKSGEAADDSSESSRCHIKFKNASHGGQIPRLPSSHPCPAREQQGGSVMPIEKLRRARRADCVVSFALAAAFSFGAVVARAAPPKVVLISLDGATPELVHQFVRDGTLPRDRGLGLLIRTGVTADRNVTVNPSLTAAAHIAMATGSTAARNDIPSNTFHLVASPFIFTISGFSAPIGGYTHHGPEESQSPTAEPLWLAIRSAGKRVVTATFPGGDGLDVRGPGLAGGPLSRR